MIHAQAEIAAVVVVDVVAVKADQIPQKRKMRIQQQQRMILKNQPHIVAADAAAHLVMVLYQVKLLKKMA
jgi:hypothetical protein